MQGKNDDARTFVRHVSRGTTTHKTFFRTVRSSKRQHAGNPKEVQSEKAELTERLDPTWTSDTLIPALNRRNEQLYIDTQNALCSLRTFQTEIIDRKSELSVGGSSIESIAESVCDTWKITDGTEWVIWLIKNWDPVQSSYPPLSTQALSESFPPWILSQDYLQETEKTPSVCQRATITLHAGISKRDAQRLVDFVLKSLGVPKGRGGRPRLTDRERGMMHKEFDKLGIPKPAKRTAMISKVQKSLMANGCAKISMTTIGNEMRKWLRIRGQSVRRYLPG